MLNSENKKYVSIIFRYSFHIFFKKLFSRILHVILGRKCREEYEKNFFGANNENFPNFPENRL